MKACKKVSFALGAGSIKDVSLWLPQAGLEIASLPASRICVSQSASPPQSKTNINQLRRAGRCEGLCMDVMISIEELIPSSISTDAMLPSQYGGRSHQSAASGEMRLMSAVLEDAVGIYLNHRSGNRKPGARLAFNEVRAWLNSSSRIGPFAFLNLCEALGIDAANLLIRLKLRRTEIESEKSRRHYHRARTWSYGDSSSRNEIRRAG